MKKKAVAKSKKSPKAKAKKKTLVKARSKSVKAKSVKAPKKAKMVAKPKMKAKTKAKEDHGLTVIDLFRMKQEREQAAAQDAEAWKHKKDLPQQDQHQPEDAKGPVGKKSGFGGARHH